MDFCYSIRNLLLYHIVLIPSGHCIHILSSSSPVQRQPDRVRRISPTMIACIDTNSKTRCLILKLCSRFCSKNCNLETVNLSHASNRCRNHSSILLREFLLLAMETHNFSGYTKECTRMSAFVALAIFGNKVFEIPASTSSSRIIIRSERQQLEIYLFVSHHSLSRDSFDNRARCPW